MRPTRRPAASATVAAALLCVAVLPACTGDDAGGDPTPGVSSPSETSSPPDPTDSGGTGTSPSEPSGTPSPETSEPADPSTSPTGVATGSLAKGFPTDVIPLLPGSTITVSTVSEVNGARTVSLSGTTPTPAEEVLAFYRTSLVGQGFAETAGGQAVGFPTSTFSRGNGADLLVIAVSTVNGVQTFTIGGSLAG